MEKLKEALEKLEATPFPQNIAGPSVGDLFVELTEIDSYVVGMARSTLAGINVNTEDLPKIIKGYDQSLSSLRPENHTEEEKLFVKEAKPYWKYLKTVAEVLIGQKT